MTDGGGAGPERPAPPSRPPHAPQGWSGGARRTAHGPEGDEAAPVLAPRERALIDEAVAPVGSRGRGPVLVAGLVVAAFILGLLRPWDLLGPASGGDGTRAAAAPVAGVGNGSPPGGSSAGTAGSSSGVGSSSSAGSPGGEAASLSPTCAYPLTWRTATIESWSGRRAHVWKAAEVVPATGPDDPSIPFEPIMAETITAIGWCAPVEGPERPPIAATATLYRLHDGVATLEPYERLEPAGPDALGELLVPPAAGAADRPVWQPGRYVIELRSASGGYVRYLGLELGDHVVRPTPSASSVSPSPSASASP